MLHMHAYNRDTVCLWHNIMYLHESAGVFHRFTQILFFSFRSLFSRKSKEPKTSSHNATNWRLFGKTAAKEGDQTKDLDDAAQQVGNCHTHL